ncbi:MAG: class I SAM-dependent methyltransferase [Algoriphagus sp.]|uniref:class I SAM-dependent methyltransferase n=1 Tax=Algoriphagus sp. TaxID=1872435 RepID=UPI0026104030|nr:class I SAM-dependent methyltransferase [Algoriphagus sp.]MDG1277529.1 class I SAM-dependent methyltransferase [Algoriphagus sp.]
MINLKLKDAIYQIYSNQMVLDIDGHPIPLNSQVDEKEGNAIIQLLLKNPEIKDTIEIGFAMGLSAMHICAVTSMRSDSSHTIIDPYQTTNWKSIGISNLKRSEVSNFELIEKKSEIALPELLGKGKKFDFGLIDGWHTFDHTLLDFFYLEKMIRPGGIIAIDDVMMPGINKALRYILKYPNIELVSVVPFLQKGKMVKRDRFLNWLFKPIKLMLPIKYHPRVFSHKILQSDDDLNLYVSMVFLRKKFDDTRPWNWFKEF